MAYPIRLAIEWRMDAYADILMTRASRIQAAYRRSGRVKVLHSFRRWLLEGLQPYVWHQYRRTGSARSVKLWSQVGRGFNLRSLGGKTRITTPGLVRRRPIVREKHHLFLWILTTTPVWKGLPSVQILYPAVPGSFRGTPLVVDARILVGQTKDYRGRLLPPEDLVAKPSGPMLRRLLDMPAWAQAEAWWAANG